MVQLIVGKKGKGKTKQLLDKVNAEVKTANGNNRVYWQEHKAHVWIKQQSTSDFRNRLSSEKQWWIYRIYLRYRFSGPRSRKRLSRQLLKVAKLEGEDITDCVEQLEGIGKQYNITFVLSVSMDKEELPEGMQDKIIVAL